MRTEQRELKYKGFKGTVEQLDDGTLSGRVLSLKDHFTYQAGCIDELEREFKNCVDRFFEHCAILGVEPEPIGRKEPSKNLYWALFFAAVFAMGWLWWFYTGEFPLTEDSSQSSSKMEWFDKFGSFFNNFSAPILSFCSFAGLLFTIFQQNRSHQLSLKELALTREELELTRKEIEKTTEANEDQAEALRQQVEEAQSAAEAQRTLAQEQRVATQIQQFETSFYALLAEHNQALGGMVSAGKENSQNIVNLRSVSELSFRDVLREIQDDAQLCRYFRMLYQLLKFIATNHVGNASRDFSNEYLCSPVLDQEKRYASLVRSMLPQNVLGLLAVNCCDGYDSNHSYHKYFLLIQRYAFLEHLNVNSPLALSGGIHGFPRENAMATIIKTYDYQAFGSSESLKGLELQLKKCFESTSSKPDLNLYVLCKAKSGSVCDDMMQKHLPENSSFWEIYKK
ncbi:hypothetical protein NB618_04200 [Vibrio antiquarius]|uniref:putative phage abortive infection protein n=1 Tax=Vibrio antiquarius (strain Ex25) TaxID=150340 RepID=UPI0026580A9F|nr:putative phage abortive infection protein [Vibrio antiquarius]MCR9935643.1 hypothetical protein [Vibrio antiquarius]